MDSGYWYVIGIVVVAGFAGKLAESWRLGTVKMAVDEIRAAQTAGEETRPLDERALAEIRQVVRATVRKEMLEFVEEWERSTNGQIQPWANRQTPSGS